ncbi:MAG TPA: oligosaccharide flippase family protein [bacterium]|jgi:O-antigen/teichoic acid export membrane protein|nr:oligosaccharide flippase family protein [bacterium]
MGTLRQRVRAGFHYTLLNRVLVNGVPAIVALAAVRVVSIADFGLYNVLIALAGLVGKLTSMGWPEAIARYVPRLDARDDGERLAGLLVRALGWRFLLTSAVAGAMVVGFNVIAPIFKLQGSERAFLLFAATVVFTTQNFLLTAAIESLLLQRILFAIGTVASLVQIAYMIVLYVRGGSLVALMWMELTRSLVLYVLSGYFVFHVVGQGSWWRALRTRRPFVDTVSVRYRWQSFLNDISQEIFSRRSDYLMLSYLASAVAVAVYAVPARVVKFVEMLVPVSLLKGPLESAFYRSYERDRSPDRLNQMYQTLTKVNLTVLGFFLAVSVVFAPAAFVLAFGPPYRESGLIFSIFIIVMTLYYYPFGFVLRALERMDLVLWAKTSAVLYFVLAVFFVRWWGAVGMALATASALLAKNFIAYWLTRRAGGIRMPWAAIGRIALNVAATSTVLLVVRAALGDGWAGIGAGGAAAVAAYGLLTFVNSGYSADELRQFADLLPGAVSRSRPARAVLSGMLQRAQVTASAAGVGPR